MKKFAVCIATAILISMAGFPLFGQQYVAPPVEISQSKVRIADVVYYEHTVKAKQTLFSICKAYNVTVTEVTELNADKLSDGLKIGDVLLIPVRVEAPSTEEETNAEKEKSGLGKVASAAGEKISTFIESLKGPEDTRMENNTKGYIFHRVKWFENMSVIARRYGVEAEAIRTLNGLADNTLTAGQMLKIPMDVLQGGTGDWSESGVDTTTAITATLSPALSDTTATVAVSRREPVLRPYKGAQNIGLILPFSSRQANPSTNFLDFYSGVLMALDEIKETGTDVNLTVIDASLYDSAEDLVEECDLQRFDFVIGHFGADDLEVVASCCDTLCIPLVSPMDQKLEPAALTHPFLISIPVGQSALSYSLAESLDYESERDNVLLVYENGDGESALCRSISSSLDSIGIPFTRFSYGIVSGRNISSTLKGHLSSSRRNHVIVCSEKESFASDAYRNLSLLAREYDLTVYGNHKIRSFESIEQEALQATKAHFSLGFYVDYTDDATKSFVRKYRALFASEPTPFAFQGHDTALYMMKAMKQFGPDMIYGLESFHCNLLQLSIELERMDGSSSGLVNHGSRDIIYRDRFTVECN
ncbi:MAG: LysM peptidoglycan-binding domain-containing protein [Bacteroidales bacterium]|nr:LysM peptidoglycan-binding domain-containing protein [Bacteroidales bacterium]